MNDWKFLLSCFWFPLACLITNGQSGSYKAACDVSEFLCPSKSTDGALCLPMDRWCDGKDDCQGRVDEPRSCSLCNRTYFGRLGSTYRISVVRPRMGGNYSLPWKCWMNFTALGGNHGNQILLSLDSFSVGRLNNSKCQGGQVSLRDSTNIEDGWSGAWCGQSWGQPMFRSEGPWVKMDIFMEDMLEMSRFRLDLTYRFLPQPTTTSSKAISYGEPVPGTLCSRNLQSCDQKNCVILSPNYPGLYPRNATCYYYIRQSWKPRNASVLISVGQSKSHLFWLRASSDSEKGMVSSHHCFLKDSLSIYNGATTESPLLAQICGSGPVARISAVGSEMLLVFRTSSYDSPYNPVPLGFNSGFSLDVKVQFLQQVSPCKLRINSNSSRRGVVNSPEVTLAPGISCVYELVGKSNERVWLAFTSYLLSAKSDNTNQSCMAITDGEQVIHNECGSLINPRMCTYASIQDTFLQRPCHLTEESYVSSGSLLKLEQQLTFGTLVEPWRFSFRYEFVTVDEILAHGDSPPPFQTEDSFETQNNCWQHIKNSQKGSILSPQNLFLYGRGGQRNLTCVYHIEANSQERISLTLETFHIDDCCGASCACLGCIQVDEYFWFGANRRLHKQCRSLNEPLKINSSASALRIQFEVINMNWAQDYSNFHFSAMYDVLPVDASCRQNHEGTSRGTIAISSNSSCSFETPWFVQAPTRGHLLFQLPSNIAINSASSGPEDECLTNNKLIFYTIENNQASIYREVCLCLPVAGLTSERKLFSPGWHKRSLRDDLLVIPSIKGDFTETSVAVSWMAVYKDLNFKSSLVTAASAPTTNQTHKEFYCFTPCPSLGVCLPSNMWCDKHQDCPDNTDEMDCVEFSFWPIYAGIGCAVALIAISISVMYLMHRYNNSRSYHVKRTYKSDFSKQQYSVASYTVSDHKRYEKAGPGS